jgi:hypothetical protein
MAAFVTLPLVVSCVISICWNGIRLHMLSDEKSSMPTAELAEDLIGLVRAYLK